LAPWIITLLTNLWIPFALFAIAMLGRHYEYADRPGAYIMHIIMLIGINVILAVSLQLINGISGQFSLGHAGFMAVGAYLAGYATKTFAAIASNGDDPNTDFYNPAATLLFFIALGVAVILAGVAIYALFLLIRRSRRLHSSLPSVLLVIVLAWFAADIAKGLGPAPTPHYLVFTRLISADHHLYDTILAHGLPKTLAWSNFLPEAARKRATFLIALIGGGGLAAIAGLVVGLPTLRLRGDYLAIATLGFGEIIRVAIVNSQALGGATGLQISPFSIKPDLEDAIAGYYISPWIYGTVLLTILIVWRLKHSPKGRALRALCEDEIAAAAVGIDTTRHKVMAFVIGAFLAGVAGALYAHLDGYLNTNSPTSFGFIRSIEIVVMVTLGGLGNIAGAAIAAVVLTILPEVLDNISPAVAQYRMVIYSVLLIGLMLLRTTPLWSRRPWRRNRAARQGVPLAVAASTTAGGQ
jgi:branched-chain amino acid transport system permease protein